MATLTVEISAKNSASIMEAISLIKGVKKVFANEDDIETHKDREAWVRGLEDLRNGETVSFEELKRKYL